VIASHPGHLFARCNLAGTLILEGAIDEAEALLDSAEGDEDVAQSLLGSLQSMMEDDDEARFAQVRKAVERLDHIAPWLRLPWRAALDRARRLGLTKPGNPPALPG
jgi:hypothetical protein